MILAVFSNLNNFIILKRKIFTSRYLGVAIKSGWLLKSGLKLLKAHLPFTDLINSNNEKR